MGLPKELDKYGAKGVDQFINRNAPYRKQWIDIESENNSPDLDSDQKILFGRTVQPMCPK